MDAPKRSHWHTSVNTCSPLLQNTSSHQCSTAPRSALRNVSNGQAVSLRNLSSVDWHKTPTKVSQGALSASAKRINLSIRREFSKSHGDLSNLRPKTPPIQTLPTRLHGLHLSPGNYVDDTQNLFSPSYNRQARQAIPNDWMTRTSGSRPSTTTEASPPTGQQMHQSSLQGMHVSPHKEAESATISIWGLTSGYVQPLDFCVPVTRSHPGNDGQRCPALHSDTARSLAVEHLNISTAWNGLSDLDANELFRVHRAFVSTLEKMLADELWQIYQQLQQQDSAGNISPIHTLFSAGIVRGISFCRDHLVSEMAEALYSSEEHAAKARSGFLRLYLVATDALVQHHEDSSRDTSITIRMRCDALSPRPYPVVDAAWVPDFLIFEDLDEYPLEGQRFSVVPRYCSESAFRPTRFPENVKYSVESESRHSLSWLVWDDEIAGFKGIVPFYSEAEGYDRHVAKTIRDSSESISHSLKIIVQAMLVDDNGSSIRYERILRARLTIKVVPWYVNDNSRETKEQLSVPKVFQDTRLASAAQLFALQDLIERPSYPARSLTGLSQREKRAHQYMPAKCVHTGEVGFRDNHLALNSPATGAGRKETGLPSLARTQAYLVAKCAELKKELEYVEEQLTVSSEHHKRTLHASDPQEPTNNTCCVPSDQHMGQDEPTSRSSVQCISHDATMESTNRSSPFLHTGNTPSLLGPIARFSALPPPAVSLKMRPKYDLQIKEANTLKPTRTGWDSIAGPGTDSPSAAPGYLMVQNTHSIQEFHNLWRLPNQASISLKGTSRSPSFPRQDVAALSTAPSVKAAPATLSTLGKRGRKQRARPRLNKRSSLKHFGETGKQPKQETAAHSAEPSKNTLPILNSDDQASCSPTQRSSDIFYNSFGPLRSFRSSATLASEDALCSHVSERGASTNSSGNIKHGNQDSGCDVATKNTGSDDMVNKNFTISSGYEDGATTAEGVLSKLFFPDTSGQVRLCQNSSASFSPRHVSTSSTSGTRSTSSDMEFIVEQDPRAREVSRQEQAKSWKLLSRSDSNRENQPRPESQEVRLGEDEKKAMDEAMQRSLDDLAEGFDDIFLEDSSEQSSGDCSL